MPTPVLTIDAFRNWAHVQFHRYKGCIAFVESMDGFGDVGIGTCFHVGDGIFLTARHVLENRTNIKIDFDDNYAFKASQNVATRTMEHPGQVMAEQKIT